MLSWLLVPLVATLSSGCGVPDRSHPPKLRMTSDAFTSLSNGIVGGAEAEPHSYPWQVWLFRKTPGSNTGFACGGSLIDEQWIVTASHCVVDDNGRTAKPSRFKIMLGQHSIWKGTQKGASRVLPHPSYKGLSKGIGYDIALVKLDSPVSFDDKIKAICLPSSSDSWRKDGENVVVSGWGALATGAQGPNELHHVMLKTDIGTCQSKWRLSDNEMCAIGNGKDSCQGDSGGPLVARRSNKFVLAGVVSYGADCAEPGLPAVYAHVPYFRDWIKKVTSV